MNTINIPAEMFSKLKYSLHPLVQIATNILFEKTTNEIYLSYTIGWQQKTE